MRATTFTLCRIWLCKGPLPGFFKPGHTSSSNSSFRVLRQTPSSLHSGSNLVSVHFNGIGTLMCKVGSMPQTPFFYRCTTFLALYDCSQQPSECHKTKSALFKLLQMDRKGQSLLCFARKHTSCVFISGPRAAKVAQDLRTGEYNTGIQQSIGEH